MRLFRLFYKFYEIVSIFSYKKPDRWKIVRKGVKNKIVEKGNKND